MYNPRNYHGGVSGSNTEITKMDSSSDSFPVTCTLHILEVCRQILQKAVSVNF